MKKHRLNIRSIRNCVVSLILLINITALFGCYPSLIRQAQSPEEALRKVHYFYPKFQDDMDLSTLAQAIRENIKYLKRLNPEYNFYYGPHTYSCRHVLDSQIYLLDIISKNPDPVKINKEIREHFLVYKATGRVGNRKVLFTGYFEPIYEGSLRPDNLYKYPLYRKPDDLINIDLSLFREEFKGKRIIVRIEGKKVLPYFSREQIEIEKALKGRDLEIAWLKDPVDVAFLHIQGSGRLKLPDERTISVGYQAANGRPYRSIGRYMLDKGFLSWEKMSMQSIRRYLRDRPEIINEVLNYNPSYIFFRLLDNGPFGNINVLLTPGRSLALDSRLFPKGALCYISGQKPVIDRKGKISSWTNFSRFIVNQDTGGAIKGAGRADIFWGNDDYAQLAAGHMKHEGELYVLIKKPLK